MSPPVRAAVVFVAAAALPTVAVLDGSTTASGNEWWEVVVPAWTTAAGLAVVAAARPPPAWPWLAGALVAGGLVGMVFGLAADAGNGWFRVDGEDNWDIHPAAKAATLLACAALGLQAYNGFRTGSGGLAAVGFAATVTVATSGDAESLALAGSLLPAVAALLLPPGPRTLPLAAAAAVPATLVALLFLPATLRFDRLVDDVRQFVLGPLLLLSPLLAVTVAGLARRRRVLAWGAALVLAGWLALGLHMLLSPLVHHLRYDTPFYDPGVRWPTAALGLPALLLAGDAARALLRPVHRARRADAALGA